MKRRRKSEFLDDQHHGMAIVHETAAHTDFSAARAHAIALVNIHDDLTGAKAGRPGPWLEALKRSSLILTVTAWESFVEDTIVEQLEERLEKAKAPSDVSYVFNSVADEWLDPSRSPRRHGPDLVRWTGDGWKSAIREALSKALETFHTPNSHNTDQMFKRFLGISITRHWSWRSATVLDVCRQLDALIALRGRVVHRGKRFWPYSLKAPNVPYSRYEPDVRRTAVVKALNLVYHLMGSTEHALGISRKITKWPDDILAGLRDASREKTAPRISRRSTDKTPPAQIPANLGLSL